MTDPNQAVTVYTPDDRRNTGFVRMLLLVASHVYESRELIRRLFMRDFLARHRKSFLGIAWIVLGPVMGIVTWLFMNATGILRPGATDVPYPVYLLLGMSLWTLFMAFYSAAAETLGAGQGFILQVKYPHEALLVKQLLEPLATFAMAFVVNLFVLAIFRVAPSWQTVFLPFALLPLMFLGAGLGLFAGLVSIVAQEAKRVIDMVLALTMWITPIIYSSNVSHPWLETAMRWNPLTYLIGGARGLILNGTLGPTHEYLLVASGSLVVFVLSLRLFFLAEHRVIEKIL